MCFICISIFMSTYINMGVYKIYIERERSVTSTSITHECVARDEIICSVLRHEPLATLLIALIKKN